MLVEISESESEYLTRLLDEAHTELLHGLHRTDSFDYRDHLRANVEINERLRMRIAEVLLEQPVAVC